MSETLLVEPTDLLSAYPAASLGFAEIYSALYVSLKTFTISVQSPHLWPFARDCFQ